MDAYQDFCRDCCVRSLLNHLFALCLGLLISDELCRINIVSIALNLIDRIGLDSQISKILTNKIPILVIFMTDSLVKIGLERNYHPSCD